MNIAKGIIDIFVYFWRQKSLVPSKRIYSQGSNESGIQSHKNQARFISANYAY